MLKPAGESPAKEDAMWGAPAYRFDRFCIDPDEVPEIVDKRLCVFGDVRMDVTASLRETIGGHLDEIKFAPAEILLEPGGTGLSLAQAARRTFREVYLICGLGKTSWPSLDGQLGMFCPEGAAVYTDWEGQGCSVSISSRNADGRPRRVMVANDSPYFAVTANDIADRARFIIEADGLAVDAYALLNKVSSAAVMEALRIATGNGVPTFIDVVPHDITTRLGWSELLPAVELASVVTVETGTLATLLREEANTSDFEGLVRVARTSPTQTWLLRHGVGMIDRVTAFVGRRERLHYRTGYRSTISPRGFGDRLSAQEYAWLLGGDLI